MTSFYSKLFVYQKQPEGQRISAYSERGSLVAMVPQQVADIP